MQDLLGKCSFQDWKLIPAFGWMSFHSDELRKEARQLKKELLAIKQRKEDGVKKEEDVTEGECLCHKITAVYFSHMV